MEVPIELAAVLDQLMRRDTRDPFIAEVVAPELLARGAIELEQEAVVTNEIDRVVGRESLAIHAAARGIGPLEAAVFHVDGVELAAGCADISDAVAQRGARIDRGRQHRLPFRPRPGTQRGHRRFRRQRLHAMQGDWRLTEQDAVDLTLLQRDLDRPVLVEIRAVGLARQTAGNEQAIEVEDLAIDGSRDRAFVVALELEA